MVNTTNISKEDMINNLQELRGKTKLKFYKNLSNYYDEIKFRIFQPQEDPFAKNAQSISKIYHEVIIIMNFLQTKPEVNVMNINYFDSYYTVIKTRDDNEVVDDKYEDKENDYNNFNDFIFLIIMLEGKLVKQY